jgi:hypothetical protein
MSGAFNNPHPLFSSKKGIIEALGVFYWNNLIPFCPNERNSSLK